MRAFIAGVAAAIIIAVAAGVILDMTDQSTGQEYSTGNVRL